MSRRLFASLLLAAVALTGLGLPVRQPVALAAPEPAIVPVSWELEFKHGNLERLFVTIDGKQKTFWYMRYTVINNTGKDILFTPSFELVGDTGSTSAAFKNVPNEVFTKLKETYKNTMLESPTGILGRLLQGADNAKDGVIIFTDVDAQARDFKLFIGGLSGETAEVANPVTGKPVILQKTLELDYNIPGEAIGIDAKSLLKATKWVMK